MKLHLLVSKDDKSTNCLRKLNNILRHWSYEFRIKGKESNFEPEVKRSIHHYADNYQSKSNRHRIIDSDFNEAVEESAQPELVDLERKNSIISGLRKYIYGALGEQKVAKILETLPNEYFLIPSMIRVDNGPEFISDKLGIGVMRKRLL